MFVILNMSIMISGHQAVVGSCNHYKSCTVRAWRDWTFII